MGDETTPEAVLLLWQWRDLIGVYPATAEGRAAAETDAQWLRDEDQTIWDDGRWQVTREYRASPIEIEERVPLTAPRYEGRGHGR